MDPDTTSRPLPLKSSPLGDAIPVIVGVTGHRDLLENDLPMIRGKVSAALESLERLTRNSPRMLLSALAEGADQLVAEAALERGWQVVAVLPMPLDDFMADFATDAAKRQFRGLLERCVDVQALDPSPRLDHDISNHRDQQYREQGTVVVRQAQVMLALWDGQDPGCGSVGTSWAVRICRKVPPSVEGEVLAAPETTGLIHIPVRRAKAPESAPVPVPEQRSDEAYRKVLKEIDALNSTLARGRMTMPEDVAESLSWLVPPDRQSHLDEGDVYLLGRYAEADALARRYQAKRKQIVLVACVLTVIAAISQATYGVVSSQRWIVAYGVAIVLAYVLYYLLFKLPLFRIEERFLEYRAFAEAARVQLFWRLAGLNTLAAEHYLQFVKSDVGWVREAARAMGFLANLQPLAGRAKLCLIRERWLLDQINYFYGEGTPEKPGNIAKRRRWQARSERVSTAAFAVGVALVLIAGLGYLLPAFEEWKNAASGYSASLFLIAGVVKGFAATMGYKEEAAGFEKAGAVFRNALAFVDAHRGDDERFRACIKELGKYALAENADWLLQHRRNAFKLET